MMSNVRHDETMHNSSTVHHTYNFFLSISDCLVFIVSYLFAVPNNVLSIVLYVQSVDCDAVDSGGSNKEAKKLAKELKTGMEHARTDMSFNEDHQEDGGYGGCMCISLNSIHTLRAVKLG